MRSFLLFLALAPVALAQLDSNSVTVSATRAASLQPDQVVFAVTVDTPMDVSLNDVVAALQSAGITLSNLAGVRTQQAGFLPPGALPPTPIQTPPPQVEWTFALPVPISKLTDTASALRNVQQSVNAANRSWTVAFSVQGTQVSLSLQQSQVCSYPDLLNDARVQAQKLASAAGMSVGNVLAMSSATSAAQAGSGVYAGFIGPASLGTTFLPPQICTATVKFALK